MSSLGPLDIAHAPLLRRVSDGKRLEAMMPSDWRERVQLFALYLEHEERLLAELAHDEIARAPYAAMRTRQPELAAAAWLCADLEMRGTTALADIERNYLADATLELREVRAALLALSVQGSADASCRSRKSLRPTDA